MSLKYKTINGLYCINFRCELHVYLCLHIGHLCLNMDFGTRSEWTKGKSGY